MLVTLSAAVAVPAATIIIAGLSALGSLIGFLL